MTMYGADIEQVESLALQFHAAAQRLTHISSTTHAAVTSSPWRGTDSELFLRVWSEDSRPRIAAVVAALEQAVTQLRHQAEQQRQASAAEGGALHAGAGSSAGGPGRLPGPATTADMLKFIEGAYGGDVDLPDGWSKLTKDQLLALGVEPILLTRDGLNAAVYTDGHGHYVVAYAGSTGALWETDWVNNGGTALSLGTVFPVSSSQAQAAMDLALKMKLAVGVDNLQFTGHSLGGGEAGLASMATGAKATTFNASPATAEDMLYARTLRGDDVSFGEYLMSRASRGLIGRGDESQITNYITSRDALSGAERLGGVDALGHDVVVDASAWNPLKAHDLDQFDGKV